jgi:hypothetical protein
MVGDITDIRPDVINKTAVITGTDRLTLLGKQSRNSVRLDSWLTTDIVEWMVKTWWLDGTVIDVGGTTIPYWWIDAGKSILDNIQDVADAELSTFFLANDGVLKYYLRDKAQASVETIFGTDIQKDIELTLPWENIKNDFRVAYYPRLLTMAGEWVWYLTENMYLGPGATAELYTQHTYLDAPAPCLALSILYAASSLPNGGGVNMTGNLSVVLEPDWYALSRKATLYNNHATDGLYITFLKVAGVPAYNPYQSSYRLLNDASVALYGPKLMPIDNIFVQSIYQAVPVAAALQTALVLPTKVSRVKLLNNYAKQFMPDLFDRVRLNIADPDVVGNFRVGAISHEWLDGSGSTVLTIMRLEPYFGTAYTDDGDFVPTIGADDCDNDLTIPGFGFDPTSILVTMGDIVVTGVHHYFDAGVRSRVVLPPQGATITAAWVEFVAVVGCPGVTCHVLIKGELNAVPLEFTTAADFNGRTRTVANVPWTPGAWVEGTTYITPSLVSIIQEIVNLPAWMPGGDLVLFFANDASDADAVRLAASIENGVYHEPILHIEWFS